MVQVINFLRNITIKIPCVTFCVRWWLESGALFLNRRSAERIGGLLVIVCCRSVKLYCVFLPGRWCENVENHWSRGCAKDEFNAVASSKIFLGTKIFHFRLTTVCCLGYRLSKPKMIRYCKNCGACLLAPWLRLWISPAWMNRLPVACMHLPLFCKDFF